MITRSITSFTLLLFSTPVLWLKFGLHFHCTPFIGLLNQVKSSLDKNEFILNKVLDLPFPPFSVIRTTVTKQHLNV